MCATYMYQASSDVRRRNCNRSMCLFPLLLCCFLPSCAPCAHLMCHTTVANTEGAQNGTTTNRIGTGRLRYALRRLTSSSCSCGVPWRWRMPVVDAEEVVVIDGYDEKTNQREGSQYHHRCCGRCKRFEEENVLWWIGSRFLMMLSTVLYFYCSCFHFFLCSLKLLLCLRFMAAMRSCECVNEGRSYTLRKVRAKALKDGVHKTRTSQNMSPSLGDSNEPCKGSRDLVRKKTVVELTKSRAVSSFVVVLALCHFMAAVASDDAMEEVVILSLPMSIHLEPLLCIASELVTQSSDTPKSKIRVTVLAWNNVDDIRSFLVHDLPYVDVVDMGDLDAVDQSRKETKYVHPFFDGRLETLERCVDYHEPMLVALLQYFDKRREPLPKLIVVDRYTFAGMDIAHHLNVPFLVHSSSMLLDLDDPPHFVPTPFTGIEKSEDVWHRVVNVLYRWWYRAEMLKIVKRINESRSRIKTLQLGLSELAEVKSRWDLYGNSLVISESGMDCLEYPRPMSPLIQVVGAILPPSVDAEKQSCSSDGTTVSHRVVIIHGDFNDHQLEAIGKAVNAVGYQAVQVGISCLSHNGVFGHIRKYGNFPNHGARARTILITSGDLACVHAACASNVVGSPVLVLPASLEQHELGRQVERIGIGINLPYWRENASTPNTTEIESYLREIISDDSYEQHSTDIGFSLRRQGGGKKAAALVKLVANYGTSSFVPPSRYLPWYQVYLLDIAGVLLAVVASSLVFLKMLWFISILLMNGMSESTSPTRKRGRRRGVSTAKGKRTSKTSKDQSRGRRSRRTIVNNNDNDQRFGHNHYEFLQQAGVEQIHDEDQLAFASSDQDENGNARKGVTDTEEQTETTVSAFSLCTKSSKVHI